MFGIGGFEFLLIALVALLLLGPDKVPEYARKLGKVWAEFKRYQATMESVIKAEMQAGEKEADAERTAAEAPVGATTAFEDDDEDEEEE